MTTTNDTTARALIDSAAEQAVAALAAIAAAP